MNWKNEAIGELEGYVQRKNAIESIKLKIKLLDQQMVALKGIYKDEAVMGGKSYQEERWLQNISERQKLEFTLKIVEMMVALVEKGLSVLSIREKRVLEGFYIEQEQKTVEQLCREFAIEKSQLYRTKDKALKKFTKAMYGVVEI